MSKSTGTQGESLLHWKITAAVSYFRYKLSNAKVTIIYKPVNHVENSELICGANKLTGFYMNCSFGVYRVKTACSDFQGSSLPLKYWPHPFLPSSPSKKKSNSVRPALYEQPPTLIQKSTDSFFKEIKEFISNNELRTHLNVEI